MRIKKLYSHFFECCEVNGDKITIHKCVIDKAIKDSRKYANPYGSEDREEGQRDVMEDLLDIINRAKRIEIEHRIKKSLKNDSIQL